MAGAKALVQALLGIFFGVLLMYFAVRKVDAHEVLTAAGNANWAWIVAGTALYALDISLRVERWRRLLRPTVALPYRAVARSLIVGYAVNNLLPARLGEVFRADYISRREKMARSAALGTIAVERMLDGAIVIALFVIGAIAVGKSVGPQAIGLTRMAAVAITGFTTVTLTIYAIVRWHRKLPDRLAWLNARLAILAQSISSLSFPVLKPIIALSLVIWLIEAQAINCMMRAFGVQVNWAGLSLVVGIASLSALIPSAPGYVGSLQLAFVIALSPLGWPAPLGLLSATATQLFLLGPLTLAGLLILITKYADPLIRPRSAGDAGGAAIERETTDET